LSLLDHLNQIVHQDGDKAPNFVSAGCTLDASIKIYSCRVDAVHSDTYRVWGGFSKSAPELKEDEDDQEASQKEKSGGVHGFGDDEVDGDGDNSVLSVSSPTTKKSHKKRSSTIEAHPESLLQKKPENDISTDPFFQKMAASFDEGGAKGMMVATVTVQRACAMVIDSNARHDDAAASSADDVRADTLDAEELIDLFAKDIKIRPLTQRGILPTVESYVWYVELSCSHFHAVSANQACRSALRSDEVSMPALLPISQIACSWSTEELQASAHAPVVEMFCDTDLSPLHDDHAADDSSSDVDQAISI
jgi:hypothetical protein